MRNCDKLQELFFSKNVSTLSEELEEEENVSTKPCFVKVCAPMVRYSKLPFRRLVRKWGCDLAFTPMIMANSFSASSRARTVDFPAGSGNDDNPHPDRPLIVQFGANDATTLRNAVQYVVDSCDGIDLNCGCPQRWALKEGIGAALIEKPELLCDMIKQVYNSLPGDRSSRLLLSIKIRIHDDIARTVDLCRRADACGVSFITVHGRTVHERHQPVHYDAVKTIVDSLPKSLPVIVNGDITSLSDVERVCNDTGARGAMVARAILNNPALFACNNITSTPFECVQDWLDLVPQYFTMDNAAKNVIHREAGKDDEDDSGAAAAGDCDNKACKLPFQTFHHHTLWMLEDRLTKQEKVLFDTFRTFNTVITFVQEKFGLHVPSSSD